MRLTSTPLNERAKILFFLIIPNVRVTKLKQLLIYKVNIVQLNIILICMPFIFSRIVCVFAFIIGGINCFSQTVLPYKNSAFPVVERVEDLLKRMTPEEKFWQLFMIPGEINKVNKNDFKNGIFGLQVSATGNDNNAAQQMLKYDTKGSAQSLVQKINSSQKYFVEETRLGIPAIFFDEALHGLVRGNATIFPQAIGLAATWNTSLMHNVGNAIADEAKACGIRQVLSPVINIATDVRWGRVEETYGEDPFLTSEMGNAFITAFEKQNIITTPKHFIANTGDGGRDSYPIHLNERHLEEIHFPPFVSAFNTAGARSVMTSYNSLDGTPCTSNNWLLDKKLKQDWGFKGFVISDAGSVGGANVLHYTASDYADATQQAITNGLDVIFQIDFNHYKLFIPPFLNGAISQSRIDDAVRRVLRAKFELGLFEKPYVNEKETEKIIHSQQKVAVALQAARESIVLLKNENKILPLNKSLKTIAIIGEDGLQPAMGGYSGFSSHIVNVVDAVRSKLGKEVSLLYTKGCGKEMNEWEVVQQKYLSTNSGQPGLTASYFNNINLNGNSPISRIDEKVDFDWTLYSPDKGLPLDNYSVRWEGKIRSPKAGKFKIGLNGNDGFRLYINHKLLIDNWKKQSYSTLLTDFKFVTDSLYDISVEFFEPVGNAHIKLIWDVTAEQHWRKEIAQALNYARLADAVIVITSITEGEFRDRALLSLPGKQEEMIKQIAATGKPVVVVLTGGSAVVMNNWIDKVNGIVEAWYPGEQGGTAIADVLFGDYNPAGRLPIAFPLHEGQLPLVYNHKPTGRGDDYNNLSGLSLFPFGFGLSYTTFEYSNLVLEKSHVSKTDSVTVRCSIKNTGTTDGDEVVQLYIKDMLASVSQPVMQLKGFQRITLMAQETKEVIFKITPQMLSMLNDKMENVVEPGDFRIMIGASSRDIKLKETLVVKD